MTTTVTWVMRRVLLGAVLAATAIAVVPAQQRPAAPQASEGRPLRLLFLGQDREHHPSGKLLPLIAAPLARRGIQMTHVSTPEEALVASTLKHYDGLVIYANHETITPEQEQALVDFVEGGKAIIALHCASFMFTKAPRYIPIIGGQFQRTGDFCAADFAEAATLKCAFNGRNHHRQTVEAALGDHHAVVGLGHHALTLQPWRHDALERVE